MNALTASLPALRLQLGQFLASDWVGLLAEPARRAKPAPTATHLLGAQQTEWVDAVPGLEVTCLDGCVLLHYPGKGRPREVILVRGESHACASEERVAVQALVATRLRIH